MTILRRMKQPVKLNLYIEFLVLTSLVIIFAATAYQRNFVWRGEFSLWTDCVDKSPSKARPHTCLGLEYQKRGLTDKAILQYEKSISLEPRDADAHNNLGLCYFDKGWLDKAIEQFEQAVRIVPQSRGGPLQPWDGLWIKRVVWSGLQRDKKGQGAQLNE
jgi:tetratricopeptide (TPR) repeat protein